MNYQHIYHAGNFADVLKHVILLQILKSLHNNPKPVFILDTHAARGRYNLKSIEANKSKEYVDGIGRLFYELDDSLPSSVIDYVNAVKYENKNNDLVFYPGSPSLIKQYLRPQDRAAFCELNEKEFFKLHALCHGKQNIKLVNGDGYEALMSFMPPREKQGLVLIDPPFEQRNEIMMLEKAIIKSLSSWPQGIFMLWYPIKEADKFQAHFENLKKTNINMVLFELEMPPNDYFTTNNTLKKTAVIVFNPPQLLLDKQDEINRLDFLLFEDFFSFEINKGLKELI
jgi:23S rRNA (adenine2030-N6)-methyltransferase